jgi:hypothetical protein
VGGLITYTLLKESKREIATYSGKYGTTVSAYAFDYELKVYDPYTGNTIYEGIIKCDTSPPKTTTGTVYLDPYPETVTKRINEIWSNHLNTRD